MYVHEYHDRHGKLRRYFRKGPLRAALPGMPGSPSFMAAYEAAVSGIQSKIPRAPKEGTVNYIVMAYFRSAEFKNLKPKSKQIYRLILERFGQKDGHRMARDLPEDKARKVIEEIGETNPGMANLTRNVIRRLWNFAKIKNNPWSAVPLYKLGTHHTWTETELATFEKCWKVGTRERLEYDALFYTAQRVGDAVRIDRGEARKGRIHIVQEKTGAALTIRVHPALAKSIRATPGKGQRLLSDDKGDALTGNALSQRVIASARLAGLPARCVPHGLRKAAMRRLAEHGVTPHEMRAVSGHKTLKEVQRYTEEASQETLAAAAIKKLTVANRRRVSQK